MHPHSEISPALDGFAPLPPFEAAQVGDAMRPGVMSCEPDTPLRGVAQIMAEHRVHCLVLSDPDRGGGLAGVVSDVEILAATEDPEQRAAEVATELPTVSPAEPLERAVSSMMQHGVTHLVVVDPETGRPVGVLSSLDVAGVIAHGGR
jgi:CBS domain-containing protein